MQVSIRFHVSTDLLPHYADTYLAQLWHVSQANSATFGDATACHFTELVSREIVRRWLVQIPPDLWHHQGRHIDTAAHMSQQLEG